MTNAVAMAVGVVLTATPLANPEVLEESVANEVRHALDRAAVCAPIASTAADERLLGITNGMNSTERALRLVSTQRGDGRWIVGTNDVTAAAVRLLRGVCP